VFLEALEAGLIDANPEGELERCFAAVKWQLPEAAAGAVCGLQFNELCSTCSMHKHSPSQDRASALVLACALLACSCTPFFLPFPIRLQPSSGGAPSSCCRGPPSRSARSSRRL